MLFARLVVYWFCAGLLVASGALWAGLVERDGPALPVVFAIGALAGAVAAIRVNQSVGRSESRATPRAVSVADAIAFNAIGALLLGEIALRIVQRVAPNQVVWDDTTVAGEIVAQRRCWEPTAARQPCNSRGYPDEELFEPAPEDYVVALLADSFGVGTVPWEYNFATVAERELRERLDARYGRVAIHNFGVSGADLPGYRYLLETEVLDRPFDQVVLCVFVGNDFGDVTLGRGRAQRLLTVQGWLAPETARRLWTVVRGVETFDVPADGIPGFVSDPALEEPTFSERQFLEIELERMRYTMERGTSSQFVYRRALEQLDALYAAVGPRLLVVLVPDEYQVNDQLWATLLPAAVERHAHALPPSQASASFERDYPQQRLRAWAAERGVRLLDLLPALREAERDGRTYHLRDTHWNARGNLVAGRELARALLDYGGD